MTSHTSLNQSAPPSAGAETHIVSARDIPPDQRGPWLMIAPGLADHHFSDGSVGWSTPTRSWSSSESAVAITTRAGQSVNEFLGTAFDDLAGAWRTDCQAHPMLGIVVLLALWDNEFRNAGLIDGNVYLASHASLPALATVAAWPLPVLDDALSREQVLQKLTDAELLYQFPVAAKFCGGYRPDRHQRLNGFGRALASRLAASNVPATDHARMRISGHLSTHRHLYAQHMDLLLRLDTVAPAAAWTSSQRLPVGVLS